MIYLTNTRLISQPLVEIIPPITTHSSSVATIKVSNQHHQQYLNKFLFSSSNNKKTFQFKIPYNYTFTKSNKLILSCYKEDINAENTNNNNTVVDYKAGRMCYQPKTFESLLEDACAAAIRAIKDGEKKLEIEFPPLPGSANDYKGSSDDFIDANVQLALSAAKIINEENYTVKIMVPDTAEYERSSNMFSYILETTEGISMGYTGKTFLKSFSTLFSGIGGEISNISSITKNKSEEESDVYLIINHSTIELPNVRKFVEEKVSDESVVILFNLELDTLRSDLGLFGFPSKDMQYGFLAQFKSAFYIRKRDYSKTIAKAPFLRNYSGALFREYPGPWQVMLRRDDGMYVCVAEDKYRYNLFDVKEALMSAVGLNTEEPGSTFAFLRRGYKRSNWWENDEELETSKNWRI